MALLAQTKLYDSADYLDNGEAIVSYLQAALEEGDADDIRAALNAVARARNRNRKRSEAS
jgi:probable addiction module antidote protein